MFKLTLALFLLSALVSVRGHGYVQEVVSGSTKYTGYLPYQDPYYNPPPQRIIRKLPGNGEFESKALCVPISRLNPRIGPITDLSLIE